MSYITKEDGSVVWDIFSEFTDEERALINASGLTVPELREFYTKFPEQALDTAIGGCIMAKQNSKLPGSETSTV